MDAIQEDEHPLVRRLHRHVRSLINRVREVLGLVYQYPQGTGEHFLDRTLAVQLTGCHDNGLTDPEQAARWLALVAPLAEDLMEAKRLWEQVRLDFAAVGVDAAFRTIARSSHHHLAITFVDVVLLRLDREALAGTGDEPLRARAARRQLLWEPHSGLPGGWRATLPAKEICPTLATITLEKIPKEDPSTSDLTGGIP